MEDNGVHCLSFLLLGSVVIIILLLNFNDWSRYILVQEFVYGYMAIACELIKHHFWHSILLVWVFLHSNNSEAQKGRIWIKYISWCFYLTWMWKGKNLCDGIWLVGVLDIFIAIQEHTFVYLLYPLLTADWNFDVLLLQGSDLRYCQKCSHYKPPRAHHCRVCKRCVLRMVVTMSSTMCKSILFLLLILTAISNLFLCRTTTVYGLITVLGTRTTRSF